MFTGIIQHVGTVMQVRATASGRRVGIDLGPLADGLTAGASVAVNGACLTAAAVKARRAEFDVVAETLSLTTLGRLRPGSRVNLELSLRLGDGLDGHLVQGHVDGMATVRDIRRGGRHEIEFSAPAELIGQLVPKGSVAVDGVSLTLAEVSEGLFRVAIIPTTLEATTLGGLAVGDAVNIETDVIGKYVLRFLKERLKAEGCRPKAERPAGAEGGEGGAGLTLEKLREAGFA